MATAGGDDARRLGLDRPYGAMFRGNAGLALFGLGRWAEAEAITGQGMDVGHGRVWGLTVRARLLAAMGRTADGLAVLATVDAMFPEGLPDPARLGCALPEAELRLVEGNPEAALQAALRGLDVTAPHVGLRLGLATIGFARRRTMGRRTARRDVDAVELATSLADRCLAEVATQREILGGWDVPTPSKLAAIALAGAEMARLKGAPDPEGGPLPPPTTLSRCRIRRPTPATARPRRCFAATASRRPPQTCSAPRTRRALRSVPRRSPQTSVGLPVRSLTWRWLRPAAAVDPEARLSMAPADSGAVATAAAAGTGTRPSGPEGVTVGRVNQSAELHMLLLVAAGRTNGQIAMELYISPKTASVHVTHILDKLGAGNRVEAAMIAARAGLVNPESPSGS